MTSSLAKALSRDRSFLVTMIAAFAVLVVACGGGSDGPEPPTALGTDRQVETQDARDDAPPPTSTTSDADERRADADEDARAPLTPDEVFDRLARAIAFVESPAFTGSAILFDERHLLTNAHVVFPFESVRVVFADGTEIQSAQVVGIDLLADLAVIEIPSGVVPTPPFDLAESPDAAELPIGTELFLIGYPAETEALPKPSITRGILSRVREWDALDIAFIQTDAAIAGGQSGGALVSQFGEIIGISGFSFGGENFALAASIADSLERVQALVGGEDVAGLGPRFLNVQPSATEINGFLADTFDRAEFVFQGSAGLSTRVSVGSDSDVQFFVTGVDGDFPLLVDELFSGVETGRFTPINSVPYIIVVEQFVDAAARFQISSNSPLGRFRDPDARRTLSIGEALAANLDYPGDRDVFRIDLERGEAIVIDIDTINFDPIVTVDALTNPAICGPLSIDDDSGGGLFGLNASVHFVAPTTDRYIVSVEDVALIDIGGYLLTVTSDSTIAGASLPRNDLSIAEYLTILLRIDAQIARDDNLPLVADDAVAALTSVVPPREATVLHKSLLGSLCAISSGIDLTDPVVALLLTFDFSVSGAELLRLAASAMRERVDSPGDAYLAAATSFFADGGAAVASSLLALGNLTTVGTDERAEAVLAIDGLITALEDVVTRLRALSPPADVAGLHQRRLDLLVRTIAVERALRDGIAGSDVTLLLSATLEAQNLTDQGALFAAEWDDLLIDALSE